MWKKDIKPGDNLNENKEELGSVLIPKIGLAEKDTDNKKEKKSVRPKLSKKKKTIIFSTIGVLSIIFLAIGILTYSVYKKAIALKDQAYLLKDSVNSQDIVKVKNEVGNTKNSLNDFESSYNKLSFLKLLPYIGNFVKDGTHSINAARYGIEAGEILISAIEPYADIIGFANGSEEAVSGEETTQDRLDFIVKTIPDLLPKTDELIEKVSKLKEEIDQIDPNRYPETVFGFEIKSNLKKAIELTDDGSDLVKNSKPLLVSAPYLLGVDSERTYLIIFQNDKELRPTGGFITAYSIAKVSKGKFEPVISSDIYSLDSNYRPRVEAPDQFKKYLKGPYTLSNYIKLRDMNWSPDFSKSMELFTDEAKQAGIKDIDGVIAVDTQVLVNLLDVIGTISVPGFGEYSNKIVEECDCPQVIYELESFADIEGPVVWSQDEPGKIIFAPANYDNRKKIIGPLMNSLLSNALGQPKEKIPSLFQAGMKTLIEKDVLFYLFDQKAQNAVTSFGVGGTIKSVGHDYLMIVDANLGGRKSNLYVTQEILQEVMISEDGTVIKKLTITYKNPKEHDGWLNSVLPNWVRIYVPEGSKIIKVDGLNDKLDPYKEFEKTVVAGFFELRPQGVSKIEIEYELPFTIDDEYEIYLQKQPGKPEFLYTFEIGKKIEEIFLNSDKDLKFKI